MKIHHLFILLLFSIVGCKAQSASFFQKTTLQNLANEKMTLIQVVENKPFVLVVYGTDCPICQRYVPILRGIADSLQGIKFIMVFSKWETLEAINTFAFDFNIIDGVTDSHTVNNIPTHNITLLQDTQNTLIKQLKATTTPEAFFYDKNHQLQYRGAIDNWFFALGRYRPQATEYYLKNAITQYLKNEKITVSKTNPIGCLIEY